MPSALLDWAIENEADFKPTTVGHVDRARHEPTHRRSIGVSDFGPLKPALRQRALDMAPSLIDEFRVSPSVVGSVELQLVAHYDGAFLKRHFDTQTGPDWDSLGSRLLSAVYYLHRAPKAFSGGCLRLFPFGASGEDDGYLDIEPEHNTLVVFPSWAEHEVLPISCPSGVFADSRFSINIWLRAPAPTEASPGG
jgi:Rps23 Pro-64 3,4-dihydroxylase Tpa1-like proline 4-hydroxylase